MVALFIARLLWWAMNNRVCQCLMRLLPPETGSHLALNAIIVWGWFLERAEPSAKRLVQIAGDMRYAQLKRGMNERQSW